MPVYGRVGAGPGTPVKLQHFHGSAGIRLAADVGGDPARPAVVLLHGGGQTRHSWNKLARHLVQLGYHAVSLDLRGHGDSDWAPQGDYSVDAFAADLHAVLGQLQRPPVLIGASLGGITSLLAVGECERTIARGLVLVDVVPRMEEAGLRRIHAFMRANLDGFDTLDEVAAAVTAYLPQRHRAPNPQGLRKNVRQAGNGRFYWHWDPALIHSDRRPDGTRAAERLRRAARAITLPTMLVRGKLSDVVSQEGVDDLLALICGARAIEVDGAGHMVAGDQNDPFNDAVEQFLVELGEPAAARQP